jgi:hypothetical protein
LTGAARAWRDSSKLKNLVERQNPADRLPTNHLSSRLSYLNSSFQRACVAPLATPIVIKDSLEMTLAES